MLRKILVALILAIACTGSLARGTYQEPGDFLAEAFSGQPPKPAVIWLTGERKKTVNEILGHRYTSLRIRYWLRGDRSAWILEETGKDQPITVGLVINAGRLEKIKVLVFRESRGEEIRHPFFTKQFLGAQIDADRNLDRYIDGISGATLSVRAMKKTARLALYLDTEIRKQHVTSSP